MRIEDYILELLYTHDCVIIPDFGAFLTQRESAVIDTEQHEIHPPKRKLQFNSQIKNNDGLLAKHIAFKEEITYQKAVSKVHFFVEDLKLALHEGKSVKLENLGEFFQEEQIIFKAQKNQNLLLDSYGLQNISLESVKQNQTKENEKPQKVVNIRKNRSSSYLKYAAVGFIGLGIASVLGFGYYQNKIEDHNIAEQKKAEKILQNQIQAASFSIKNAFEPIVVNSENNSEINQESELNSAEISKKYHIVAGAFRVEANAHKKIKQLKKQDYKASYIGKNKYQLHQIAYASFDNKRDAINFLNQMKKKDATAWLYVK